MSPPRAVTWIFWGTRTPTPRSCLSGTNTQYYIPYPYFSRNSTYETTNAASSYNALQVTYEHRMSFGLSLLGNYTWSKCLSDQHAPQNSQYNVGLPRPVAAGIRHQGRLRAVRRRCRRPRPHGRNVQPALRPWQAIRRLHEQARGSHRGRVGDQRLLHVPKRAAAHSHMPECDVCRLWLRCQSQPGKASTPARTTTRNG